MLLLTSSNTEVPPKTGGVVALTVMEARPVQNENAPSPIEATEPGISIEVRLKQPPKTFSSIVVNASGSVTETRLSQPLNALIPIEVTELGMLTAVRPENSNAFSPMVVTEFGI